MSSPPTKLAKQDPEGAQPQEMFTIPVREETLHVGVHQLETGGVRVHTTVSERQQPVEVLLRSEEVHVERVPVDRIVAPDAAPVSRQEGATLIVPILEEILVVEKRVRIKEEVRITRAEHVRRHVDSVALKSEQVSIERFGEAGGSIAAGPDASPE